ncbi:MAG: hypothetical protein F4139_14740 [Gemmatimonadetes bacterium]|nr:hypothetical protein [Gemmatimonadota bacterium]MYA64310.1 hypothetical protein [Gemmatimonadota bacterium]MYB98858.1 hypothetical protein [Gemmatimonadota bacterium]MYH54176.1 hypothetical protein [Gemmatimonadota bacterium]MYI47404.1 hypothetical protein [Gemmatimonadota bacterium]
MRRVRVIAMPTRFPLPQPSEQSPTSATRLTAPGSAWRAAPFLAALLLALAACGDNGSEPDPGARPTSITITPQSATLTYVGATARFTARITDQNGDSYPGTVTWSASDPAIFTVAADGEVTATGGGTGTLTASFEDISATASVNVDQLPFALVAFLGDGQDGAAGETLADPLVVRAEDAAGAPVMGLLVTFEAAAGDGSADPVTDTTLSDGTAWSWWTLGDGSGVHLLTASLEDGISTEFSAAVGPLDPPSETATYRIDFTATWSSTTHPNSFPGGAHWSPLIGAVHSSRASFWEMGETSSPGMESMAETGATGTLTSEIDDQIPGNALSVVNGTGSGSPGSVRIRDVVVRLDHPHVTLVSMIAPSPDWFAGVTGLTLLNGVGQWADVRRVVLFPLDAGTDDGTSYTAGNANTSPKQPIRSLRGINPFSSAPVATLTFTRTDEPGGGG